MTCGAVYSHKCVLLYKRIQRREMAVAQLFQLHRLCVIQVPAWTAKSMEKKWNSVTLDK